MDSASVPLWEQSGAVGGAASLLGGSAAIGKPHWRPEIEQFISPRATFFIQGVNYDATPFPCCHR
jgi:hypothetical protein